MGAALPLVYAALAVLAGGYVVYLYRRREPRISGAGVLAALRVLALATVLLLLLNPSLPSTMVGAGGGRWILLDGSRSMAAPRGEDSPWAEAVRRAREAPGDARVLVFGSGARPLSPADTVGDPPFDTSRIVPALERAAESGARSVTVVSDLRLEDPAEARATARRLGLEVVVEASTRDVRSAGVAELGIDGPLEAGEPVDARVDVFATGAAGDSATVELREESRLVASRRLALPVEGRTVHVDVALPPPEEAGVVRYSARVLLDRDAFPDDDERVAYADVDPEQGNLVLVSMEPDWEPRFLLPALERVTGLPARGYLRVGGDRWLVMAGTGAAGTVEEATVREMAEGAEVLVFQGAAAPPAWMGQALLQVERRVVLARGPGTAAAAGVAVGPSRPGEWYVVPDPPASPLAGELAGAALRGLPPLSDLLPPAGAAVPGTVPLGLQLRGTGATEPALVLRSPEDGGRVAVALASGFWQWAFREGAGRDAYERLWSGVAGWLLAGEPLARGPGVRPEERVVPRGRPLTWSAEGLAGDRIDLQLSRGDTVVLDTALAVPEAGRFRTPGLDPGSYTWVASPADGSDTTEGRLDVEAWTPDLMIPRDTLLVGVDAAVSPRSASAARGRPLRAHPLPYLLVLILLSAEWIGRRRKGLR